MADEAGYEVADDPGYEVADDSGYKVSGEAGYKVGITTVDVVRAVRTSQDSGHL